MQFFIAYLVKSAVCSALMFLYYWLFLRYRKYNAYNRFYLLSAVAISLLVPFLHFEWYDITVQKTAGTFTILKVISTGESEQVFRGGVSIDYPRLIAVVIYSVISLGMLTLLIARLAWVYQMKYKQAITRMNGFDIIYTDSDKAPFSFGNNLFWKQSADMESEEGKRIFNHELVHIKQKHTLDKLFMQIILIVLWINPVYWLIQRELSLVHEFIADEDTLENSDTELFAQMLLQAHYGNVYPDIIHPFFYSPIKRRLIMLTQSKNPGFSYLRRLMVLPVLAVSIFFFSFKINHNNAPINRSSEKIVLVLDAGHGGEDKGASDNNIVEKDANLKITRKLEQLAEAFNIEAIQTRKGDDFIPLENRTRMANESSADIFLSIHVNDLLKNSRSGGGYELYIDGRNTKSSESKILVSAISSRLNSMDIRSRLVDKRLAVLQRTEMPSVLIECGHIDSKKEMALINDDAQLEKLCRNILSGVVDYRQSIKH